MTEKNKLNQFRELHVEIVDGIKHRECFQCGEMHPVRLFTKKGGVPPEKAHLQRCVKCVTEYGAASIVFVDGEPSVEYRKFDARIAERAGERQARKIERQKDLKRKRDKRAIAKKRKREEADGTAERRRREKELKREAAMKQRQAEREALIAKQKENKALRELASRELCRKHLIPFTRRMQPKYQAGWVHKDIARRLEKFSRDVAEGKSPRLMIQMPPRHGKSELASVKFPAWHLGHHPEHEIIQASYSGSLAIGFSRKVRGLLRDPDYGVLFKTRVDRDNQNAEGWMTTDAGGYVPAGVEGAVTGKGAHILIIDDPVKNAEEAESATMRENIDNWYTSTAYTRLAPGGGVLVIQTRWHLDDLSGRLETRMHEGSGDEWEIIRYPAIAVEDEPYRKAGDALHEDRYPIDALRRIERAVGPRVWSALYQQNPVSEDSKYFDPDATFQYYELSEKPKELTYYSAWDLAISKNERADWTVGLTFGVDADGNFWVVDMVRKRMDTAEIADAIMSNHEFWDTQADGIEKGHIQMAMMPLLEDEIDRRRAFDFEYIELPPGRKDKEARARPIQWLLKKGRVFFPRGASWLEILKLEMQEFPFNRSHDDTVDAIAWMGWMMVHAESPIVMGDINDRAPKPKKELSVHEKIERYAQAHGHSAKTAMSA